MDSFESIVKTILEYQGFWVQTSYKVNLRKEEKRNIGRPSSPRWEIDVLAYNGSKNEVYAIECKSYLNNPGVRYESFNNGIDSDKFKLFNDANLRRIVFGRLKKQLVENNSCHKGVKVKLGLATGKIKSKDDRDKLTKLFSKKNWILYTDEYIKKELLSLTELSYENEIAVMVAKMLNTS